MEFRNHPILVWDGLMTWPPTWLKTHGPGPNKFVSGEIGVLEFVFYPLLIPKVHLLIHTEEAIRTSATLCLKKPIPPKSFSNSFMAGEVSTSPQSAQLTFPIIGWTDPVHQGTHYRQSIRFW